MTCQLPLQLWVHPIRAHGLLCHLGEEVDSIQEPPGLRVPCCVVPPVPIGVVEVPHEDLHNTVRSKNCQKVHGESQRYFHSAVEIHILACFQLKFYIPA